MGRWDKSTATYISDNGVWVTITDEGALSWGLVDGTYLGQIDFDVRDGPRAVPAIREYFYLEFKERGN